MKENNEDACSTEDLMRQDILLFVACPMEANSFRPILELGRDSGIVLQHASDAEGAMQLELHLS